MSEDKKCPKCGATMEEGSCLVHRTWPPTGFEVQHVKRSANDENARLKVTPFRCKNCGYLELYTEVEKRTADDVDQFTPCTREEWVVEMASRSLKEKSRTVETEEGEKAE